MRRVPPWEKYLARLCLDKWGLEPSSTLQIMTGIESLVVPGAVTAVTVTTVLTRGGVVESEARSAAPGICMAMEA